MKVDLGLQVAANAFIDSLTPVVESIERAPAPGSPSRAARAPSEIRRAIAQEAYELALGFIDADRRATDEELWALIVAFAPVLDPSLIDKAPDDLRRLGITEGKRHTLGHPSPLFAMLLDHDVRTGSSWSTTYYEHAVALGFMTASLDDYTDRNELLTIERFRGMLLEAIKSGRMPEPAGAVPGSATTSTTEVDATHATPTDTTATTSATSASAETAAAAADAEPVAPPRPLDELLAELDDLVGMVDVKDEVKLVTNLLRVQELRKGRGLKTMDQSRHLIFTGNPGTGKTTVARLLAQIYRTLGVVARGQLVETDRAGLVAGYIGQTATKVVEAFDRADQGVLLIDEAYALVRGSDSDFGKEAIDTIVKLVEDRRDRVVVIAAGYPDEMGDFVAANPGLTSRFPKTIHFPDYTTPELVQIFSGMCDREHYLLDADAKKRVRLWIDAQPRTKGFGNGRLVRNLFETAVARQASRIVEVRDPTDVQLVMLLPGDIPDPPALPDPLPTAPDPLAGA